MEKAARLVNGRPGVDDHASHVAWKRPRPREVVFAFSCLCHVPRGRLTAHHAAGMADVPTRTKRQTMTKAVLGVIGGSGIYDLPGLQKTQTKVITSPWGDPSGPLLTGEIDGLPIVFLARHDKGHRFSPSDINYRANIDVLKRSGVTD